MLSFTSEKHLLALGEIKFCLNKKFKYKTGNVM